MQKASMASVNLYLSEMSHYLRSFCYFLDVVLQILLWRGQAHFSIFGHSYNVWFPIHSIWLFASVALAFEKPSLAPSVLFYGLAWTMISMNYFNSHHPYFWYRVKSFDSLMLGLVRSGTETTTPAIESTEKLSMAKNHADELQKHKADRMIALISAFLTTGLKAYKIYSGTTLSGKLALCLSLTACLQYGIKIMLTLIVSPLNNVSRDYGRPIVVFPVRKALLSAHGSQV